jgi:hypothetical protein
MISRTWSRAALVFSLTIALLSATSMIVWASGSSREPQEPTGHLTVTGKVRVNGQPAATGDIVSSGSTVETAKGSSAVVSLGKLGRVEALPETRMKLRYDDSSISILLDTGSVRVSTGPGVAATIVTRDA